MASLNQVNLIGRLGKDPEIKTFQNGGKIANVTLATDESYTDQSGQRHEQTEWHSLVFSGKLADVVHQYAKKGSQLYVGGKIRTRSWDDQQGQKHYQTEVIVLSMQLLDPKPQATQPQAAPQPAYPQAPQPYPQQGYPQGGQPYVAQGPAPQVYYPQGQQTPPPGAPQMPQGQPMPQQQQGYQPPYVAVATPPQGAPQPTMQQQLDPANYPGDLPF